MNRYFTQSVLFCAAALLYSSQVHANAGIPMLGVVWPLLWLAFIPVLFIEMGVFIKTFPSLSRWVIFKASLVANLVSTFIGVPLTWGLLVLFQLLVGGDAYFHVSGFWKLLLGVTVQAPWLLPFESEYYWMIPTACLVLFIPFYFVSAWIEGLIVPKFLKANDKIAVKKVTWKANLFSYAFLFLVVLAFLIYKVAKHH